MALRPYLRSIGTFASGTGAVTPGAPAGNQAGDVLVLVVETADQSLPTDPPTGWSVFDDGYITVPNNDPVTGVTRLSMYWQRLTGAYSEASIGDAGDHTCGIILCIADCVETGTPFLGYGTVSAASATSNIKFGVGSSGTQFTSVANVFYVGTAAFALDNGDTNFLPASYGLLGSVTPTNITNQFSEIVRSGNGGGIGVVTADITGSAYDSGGGGYIAGTMGISSQYLTYGAVFLGKEPPASLIIPTQFIWI